MCLNEIGALPEERAPSKGRFVEGILTMEAAQEQPSGTALPQLISGEAPSPEAHLERARRVGPFDIALGRAIPTQFKMIAYKCTWQPGEVIKQRERALLALQDVSAQLGESRGRWTAALPEGSPARVLNLPLIHILRKTFEYPDVTSSRDLAKGMPIVGPTPETKVLKARERKAVTTFDQWKEGLYGRNKEIVERA